MTDQLIRRMRPQTAPVRGLITKPAKATTTVTQSQNREVVHEEEKHHPVPDVVANDKQLIGFVEAAAGVTINTGDFSSLRLDCRVQLPFLFVDEESVDQAFEGAMAFVAQQLVNEQQVWVGRVEQNRGGSITRPDRMTAQDYISPTPVSRPTPVRVTPARVAKPVPRIARRVA